MSRRFEECQHHARPLHFTNAEVARIAGLFNGDRDIYSLNRLTFIRSVYERLRVTSCVTMNRLISILTNMFDRIIAEIC